MVSSSMQTSFVALFLLFFASLSTACSRLRDSQKRKAPASAAWTCPRMTLFVQLATVTSVGKSACASLAASTPSASITDEWEEEEEEEEEDRAEERRGEDDVK